MRLPSEIQSRVLAFRRETDLNLAQIAVEVGTSRTSVQRVCEEAGMGNMGRRNKWRRGRPPEVCNLPPKRLDPQEAALRIRFRSYVCGAERRSIAFELTYDQFCRLTLQSCSYCGLPPQSIKLVSNVAVMSGIDRLDSKSGYTVDNCRPCCSACNYAKRDMRVDVFEAWMDRLVSFRATSGARRS